MCDKTPVVEHLNLSLRQLARTDFKAYISSAHAVMKLYGASLTEKVSVCNTILS